MSNTNDDTPLLGGDTSQKTYGDPKKSSSSGGDDDDDEAKFLSLDYDRTVNSYSEAAVKARNESKRVDGGASSSSGDTKHKKDKEHVISDFGLTISRWVFTFFVAFFTGLTAVVIIWAGDLVVDNRLSWLNRHLQWASGYANEEEIAHWYPTVQPYDAATRYTSMTGVYLAYVGFNLALVLIATVICIFFSPESAGSGIPEVKAYLNGVQVGMFDNLHLYWTKVVGTIFSTASGLVIGPEGPVVHLGAIIGALITRTGDLELWVRNFNKQNPGASGILGCADTRKVDVLAVPGSAAPAKEDACCTNSLLSSAFFYMSHLRNDVERRNLISIGVAAGFASAFGAPVGGLLYSMEEASSFFAHDMLWRTLFGTAVATSIIAIYNGDFTMYSMLNLSIDVTAESMLTRFSEVPYYVVFGALGGLSGGLFNIVYSYLNYKRQDIYGSLASNRSGYVWCKILESTVISILTSVVMLAVPLQASWACRQAEGGESNDEEFDPSFMSRYNCPPGEINEIGALLFVGRGEAIVEILNNPSEYEPETLLAVGLVFLCLMVVTLGMPVPQGNFMPSLLLGAAFGGYTGLICQRSFLESIDPADFALIGAAAFLAGMQRNTVSLCVILMEGTGQTKIVIPMIITVISARAVGDLLSEGIYEIGMELKKYPYLMHENKDRYDMFSVANIMNTNFGSVAMVERACDIESLLFKAKHNAFVVVDTDTGEYKGLVRRDQLIAAMECKIYVETIAGTGLDSSEVATLKNSIDDETPATGHTFSSARGLPRIDDDVYKKQSNMKAEKPDWNPNTPVHSSTWLRDNVLTSVDGKEVVFGMDETLPNGRIKTNERAVVKTVGAKNVVFIPPKEKDMHIDVGSIMNKAALSVMSEFPLSKTYDLFVSMGLNNLPVLGKENKVVGMIARHDLSDEHIEKMTGYALY